MVLVSFEKELLKFYNQEVKVKELLNQTHRGITWLREIIGECMSVNQFGDVFKKVEST